MNQQTDKENDAQQRLADAYDHMMDRVKETLEELKDQSEPIIEKALENAKQRAVELKEVTEEEAERIAESLKKDLQDLGSDIATKGREVADWLRLDALNIEKQVLERLSALADQAKVEFDHLKNTLSHYDEWHTGEITGIGTLECSKCGKPIHFEKTGHIPPCPKCHGSTFRRVKDH